MITNRVLSPAVERAANSVVSAMERPVERSLSQAIERPVTRSISTAVERPVTRTLQPVSSTEHSFSVIQNSNGEVVNEGIVAVKENFATRLKRFFGIGKKTKNPSEAYKSYRSFQDNGLQMQKHISSLNSEILSIKFKLNPLKEEQARLLKRVGEIEGNVENIARDNLRIRYGEDVVGEYEGTKRSVARLKAELEHCGIGDSYKEDSWVISNPHADREYWRTKEALWTQEAKLQKLENSYYKEYLAEINKLKQEALDKGAEAKEIGSKIKELETLMAKKETEIVQIEPQMEKSFAKATEVYEQMHNDFGEQTLLQFAVSNPSI